MSAKLFVGGLAWGTTDETLRQHFAGCAEVVEARVVTDRETHRSRGFGFVTMSSQESAEAAVKTLDGSQLDGRSIRVDLAREREERPGR